MLLPNKEQRIDLLDYVSRLLNDYLEQTPELPVNTVITPEEIRNRIAKYKFDKTLDPIDVINDVHHLLVDNGLNSSHPRYFGLFCPTPTYMGIIADTMVAAYNPNLAAWHHSPVSNEIERYLIRYFGSLFGFTSEYVSGAFTNGGTEANNMGVAVALNTKFPEIYEEGILSLKKRPVLYASEECHGSILKAACLCGLGANAVRNIPSDADLKMDVKKLRQTIEADIANGYDPFLVVATVGTTSAGIIDPLENIAKIAFEFKLYMHVDAAWGGAAIISDKLKPYLKGIEFADSITLDAHKWLSVPMAGGMFICHNQRNLYQSFHVSTPYVPVSQEPDQFLNSIQWSRRFIGLKLFLTLATEGKENYAKIIESQTDLGNYLKGKLIANDWKIVNKTELPVICFVDNPDSYDAQSTYTEAMYKKMIQFIVDRGQVWISSTKLHGKTVLRACVTSFRSTQADVDVLIEELNLARKNVLNIQNV